MAHKRHELSEPPMLTFFVAQENSDLTEGRGGMKDVGFFKDKDSAFSAIKGHGVQGCGDGNVAIRKIYECAVDGCTALLDITETIYHGDSYTQKNTLGKGIYSDFCKDGWHRDWSPLANDPEFADYMRLRRKFADLDLE